MAYQSVYWKKYDRSKMFSQMDVFYNYLGEDPARPSLAVLKGMAEDSFNRHLNQIREISKNVEPYRRIAETENEKELALLREVFGQDLHINLQNQNDVKSLIEALNSVLNIKDVYNRNVRTLELSNGGMKSVVSFFPTYFLQVWNEQWEDIYLATCDMFAQGKITLEEALKKEVNKRIDNMTIEAIERMLSAQAEMKDMREDDKYNKAYQELLDAIRTLPKYRNEIIERIRSIYQLDKLSDNIAEQIKGEGHITKKQIEKKLKNSAKKPVEIQSASRGGLTLETIEKMVFNMVGDKIEASGRMARTIHTGKIGNMKADNIMTIGLAPSIIDEWLDDIMEISGSSRADNIERIRRLGELTQNADKGFIIYSSDKNYTLNQRFREQFGFSAGSALSAQSFYDVTRNVNKNARTFTGLLVNTIGGAIMDNEGTRDRLAEIVAEDIAVMLFDDYQTIGDFRGKTGARAIHIMNLGNIMIPLSVFLTMFANAVEQAESEPSDFVKVAIMTPEIEFKTYSEQLEWQARERATSSEAWSFQREQALQKTRISVRFFREFRSFITTLGQ